MAKLLILYDSQTGDTERIAEAVAAQLSTQTDPEPTQQVRIRL